MSSLGTEISIKPARLSTGTFECHSSVTGRRFKSGPPRFYLLTRLLRKTSVRRSRLGNVRTRDSTIVTTIRRRLLLSAVTMEFSITLARTYTRRVEYSNTRLVSYYAILRAQGTISQTIRHGGGYLAEPIMALEEVSGSVEYPLMTANAG